MSGRRISGSSRWTPESLKSDFPTEWRKTARTWGSRLGLAAPAVLLADIGHQPIMSLMWEVLLIWMLDIFETPVTVTPNKKFQKLEILPKVPYKYLTFTFGDNVYFWGDNVYFWRNNIYFWAFSKILGFLELFFCCWKGLGTLWVGEGPIGVFENIWSEKWYVHAMKALCSSLFWLALGSAFALRLSRWSSSLLAACRKGRMLLSLDTWDHAFQGGQKRCSWQMVLLALRLTIGNENWTQTFF